MNVMFISDTLGQHEAVLLPRGNMIVHAGNITRNGSLAEVEDFLQWFSNLNFKHKIFIAGPRDLFFQKEPARARQLIPEGVTYLEESGVEIGGLKIWGSPYNLDRQEAFSCKEDEIVEHWEKIPEGTDIVIMRTAPYGILCESSKEESEGNKALLRRLVRVEPKYFIYGHRDGKHGHEFRHGINFINASVVNTEFMIAHKPVFQWYR